MILLSAASLFVLKGKKGYSAHGSTSGPATTGGKSRRENLNMIRDMSYWYSNEFNSMPYLADYLTIVGFRESNFVPTARNPEIETNPRNAARGLFGMRPGGVFTSDNGLGYLMDHPNTLYNPRWAFVTAVDYIYRGCKAVNREKSGVTDWAAIRRWWALPILIHDFDYNKERSQENLKRLRKSITDCNNTYGTTISPDFIWQKVANWDRYPGLKVMMHAYGLGVEA